MRITVEFDTEEEFKARIKNPRKGGSGDDDTNTGTVGNTGGAPAPLMPPQQQPNAGFSGGAFMPPQGNAFPGAALATGGDPVVMGLVQRINAKIDGAIGSGQDVTAMLTWFRTQCGAEAANATVDQIKGVFLSKLAVPQLEQIAKLMNA